MNKVTLDKLLTYDSVEQAIKWAQDQYGEYPKRPQRPLLHPKANSEDARVFSESLAAWEKESANFEIQKNAHQSHVNEINDVIIQYIKEQSGFNAIPNQYADKVWSYAWGVGHSAGFFEIYLILCNLVDIFQ